MPPSPPSPPPSPPPPDHWQPILHLSTQVVLYNPTSHALAVRPRPPPPQRTCPYCRRPLPSALPSALPADPAHAHPDYAFDYSDDDLVSDGGDVGAGDDEQMHRDSVWGAPDPASGAWIDDLDDAPPTAALHRPAPPVRRPAARGRAPNYFQLLEAANASRLPAPRARPTLEPLPPAGDGSSGSSTASGPESALGLSVRVRDDPHPDYDHEHDHDLRNENESEPASAGSAPASPAVGARERNTTHATGNGKTTDTGAKAHAKAKGKKGAELRTAEGYFAAFFREECRLGMGANGSVYLCQHVLDGTPLGHFAVKKIAVGESHAYLFQILREVRLLERLHHPNIVPYHHAWLETCRFSAFGPRVPTLHILMQWAEGGSLDDFISARLGRAPAHRAPPSPSPSPASSSPSPLQESEDDGDAHAQKADQEEQAQAAERAARIRAFRALRRAPQEERARLRREMEVRFGGDGMSGAPRASWTAVHLLSAEELRSLFGDVVEGLAFLHDKSILHLDLKPGNVLLTWDEGRLVPRAMLSDFGTSRDMINSNSRARSGNTGTLEYTAPESLPAPHTGRLRQVDSKADMWSLGMVLHKLLFFRLPYAHAGDAFGPGPGPFPPAAPAPGPPSTTPGPADAPRREDEDEGATMDLLEREVRAYAGFRGAPALVGALAARRVPRAFVVLLEGLLSVPPAARPPCERVVAALREGRLDPVVPDEARADGGALLPVLVRRPSEPPPLLHAQDTLDAARAPSPPLPFAAEDGDDNAGAGLVELARDPDAHAHIPGAAPPAEKAHGHAAPAARPRALVLTAGRWRVRVSRAALVRGARACVLAAKVWTLAARRPALPPLVQSAAAALAVADAVAGGMWVGVAAGAVHVLVLLVGGRGWGLGAGVGVE